MFKSLNSTGSTLRPFHYSVKCQMGTFVCLFFPSSSSCLIQNPVLPNYKYISPPHFTSSISSIVSPFPHLSFASFPSILLITKNPAKSFLLFPFCYLITTWILCLSLIFLLLSHSFNSFTPSYCKNIT